jgi:hypothetical protein
MRFLKASDLKKALETVPDDTNAFLLNEDGWLMNPTAIYVPSSGPWGGQLILSAYIGEDESDSALWSIYR